MGASILLTREDRDTKRNILRIWADPRETSQGRFLLKDLVAYVDSKTWGGRESRVQYLKARSGFIKFGFPITAFSTSSQCSHSVPFGFPERAECVNVSSLGNCR